MKNLKLIAIAFILGLVVVSCKKEAGPSGPAGTNGTNGTNGNANVKVYGFGTTTLNSSNAYYAYFMPAGLTAGMIDSSVIITYYGTGPGSWNMANGLGPVGSYSTIQYTYISPPEVGVYLRNADGTSYSGSDVTWDSVRIFVIPAMQLKDAKIHHLDFQNYSAVRSFFYGK